MSISTNSRRQTVLNNKVQSGSDDEGRGRQSDPEHPHRIIIEEFLHPDLDSVIIEIERETEELRGQGRLAPFREGHPIGVLPEEMRVRASHQWRVRRIVPSASREEHNEHMERQRWHILALRRKNDNAMRRILQ